MSHMSHTVTFTKRGFEQLGLTPALISLLLLSFLAWPKLSRASTGPILQANDSASKNKSKPAGTLRWDEQQPGCTFSRGTDGKYRYGVWAGDIGIVLAVDARELQIIRHRVEPVFAIQLTIRYRGAATLDAAPDGITLQFMKHFKITQTSLDPDAYIQKVQADADAFDNETRRTAAKHPEQKETRETQLQEYQKSINEWIEFLGKNTFREAHLDRANPEVRGWVFFDTKSKWLGGWKTQEEFILRVPLAGKVFEFPFKLPPERGEFFLQKRQ
jgi:hypothetical protein